MVDRLVGLEELRGKVTRNRSGVGRLFAGGEAGTVLARHCAIGVERSDSGLHGGAQNGYRLTHPQSSSDPMILGACFEPPGAPIEPEPMTCNLSRLVEAC